MFFFLVDDCSHRTPHSKIFLAASVRKKDYTDDTKILLFLRLNDFVILISSSVVLTPG